MRKKGIPEFTPSWSCPKNQSKISVQISSVAA